MRARAAVLALAIGAGCSDARPAPRRAVDHGPVRSVAELDLPARIDASLERAAGFLLAQQHADGSFRSSKYAALRDGYSLTPLVLATLRFLPSGDERAYARGVDFVASLVGPDGDMAEQPSYPLHAIASAILVLNVPQNARHDQARATLVEALRGLQHVEARGVAADALSHGGWGYEPLGPTRSPTRANLSATLFAIGALRLAGVGATDPALVDALGFVERCQNDDGGFSFGPDLPDGNKAGSTEDGASYRSYGSMTADGVRALRQLGLAPAHPRMRAATTWLTRRFDPDKNPGAFRPRDEVRRQSSRYYWAWTSAHALRGFDRNAIEAHGGTREWAAAIATSLLDQQLQDGSWTNPATEMREDDPLIATAFAAAALAVARMPLEGTQQTHRR